MDRPNGKADELLDRLLLAARGVADERARQIIASARAEAEAEVHALIKSAFKASLLHAAAARLATPPVQPDNASDPSPPAPDQPDAWYVYCITRAGADAAWTGLRGVDPEFQPEVIQYNDLQALVSRVGPDALRQEDLAWLERAARAHDQAVHAVSRRAAAIPLRFGMVLSSAQAVESVLKTHRPDILRVLGELEGRQEWTLKAFMSEPAGKTPAPESAPRSGTAYLMRRRGRHRTDVDPERWHRELSALAADANVLPLRGRVTEGVAGRAPDSAELVFKSAYLVPDGQAAEFQRKVEELSKRHATEGVSFELTGPWPAYSFVHLDLSMPQEAGP